MALGMGVPTSPHWGLRRLTGVPPSIGQGVLRMHVEKESLGPCSPLPWGAGIVGGQRASVGKGAPTWRGSWAVDMAGGKKTGLAGHLSPW